MLFEQKVTQLPRLLVVDDDPAVTATLEDLLASQADIVACLNGEEAIAHARAAHFDLVLLDIEMPGMDGFEVFEQLQQLPSRRAPGVIFITSHREPHYEYQSLDLGGIDFINKPIDAVTCQLRVRNHLRLRQQQKALTQARKDIHELVSQLPVFVSYWTNDFICSFCNDTDGNWFARSGEQITGMALQDVLPAELTTAIKNNLNGNRPRVFEVPLQPPLGKIEFIEVSLYARHGISDSGGYLITFTDITQARKARQALQDEKEKLNIMLRSIGDAVIATDLEGCITFMNPIAEDMSGYKFALAKGKPIEKVMNLADASSQELVTNPVRIAIKEERVVAMALNCQLTSHSGRIYRVEDSAAPILNEEGQITGAIIVFHDISEFVAMSVKMSHLANYDQLTDLPNRVLLHDRISQAIIAAHSQSHRVALLMIDLDLFKYVNDSLGHSVGDEVIQQVANRLKASTPEHFTISRVGGDEFVLLIPDMTAFAEVIEAANRSMEELSKPYYVNEHKIRLTVSMGASIYPSDATTVEQMMSHADAAMFRAKEEGRNRLSFFSVALENRMTDRQHAELKLRNALDSNLVEVHYQPKLNLSTGRLTGAEALVRIKNNGKGLLYPDEFIPIAEETGLIHELGLRVLEDAIVTAKSLRQEGIELRIAVNISAEQIAAPYFLLTVKELLDKHQLSGSYLEFEITESTLMHDFEDVKKRLDALKSLDITIAIDDFGTGYSSLSYLKYFPLDVLKIDKSFVMDMLVDSQDKEIVDAVIHLGQSLGLRLVAEGIESEEHSKELMAMGCEEGQGYLYCKPVQVKAFKDYVVKKVQAPKN